jgi:SOS-response transcriptional repressor LexA
MTPYVSPAPCRYTMPSKPIYKESAENPSPQTIERGRDYGRWFRSALERSGLNINVLSQKLQISKPLLYAYRDDCIGSDGRFRKPSEAFTRKFATETHAVAADGLKAMGYSYDAEPSIPSPLAALSTDIQVQLAKLVQTVNAGDFIRLPVVGKAGAGISVANLELIRERMPVLRTTHIDNFNEDDLYVLKVEGYCLRNAFIADGDYLICYKSETAKNNDVVAVLEGDDAIVKRYREDNNGRKWLETDDGEPQRVSVGPDARIVGVVISRTGVVI